MSSRSGWRSLSTARQGALTALLMALLVVAGPLGADERQIVEILEQRALHHPPPALLERLPEDPQAILEQIDPHARLFAAGTETLPRLPDAHVGIGAQLGQAGARTVLLPYQDGPADRAGIAMGARLLAIDGEEVSDLSLPEVARRLDGPQGTVVTLRIAAAGTPSRPVRVVRSRYRPLTVETVDLADGQAFRIRRFRTGLTTPALSAHLGGQGEVNGQRPWVIDLRYSGGGDVFEALDVAGLFLPEGAQLAAFEDRAGQRESFVNRRSGAVRRPLILWIGPETASAAEVLAAILQYHGRAELRGLPSRGKCSIQTDVPLDDGRVLRFTERRVVLPDGSSCDGQPLQPEGPLPEDIE
ncbi:MAG: S41 family peptidase [Halothiobacillaceae bacterium]